jgi:hypothetical protein
MEIVYCGVLVIKAQTGKNLQIYYNQGLNYSKRKVASTNEL